MQKARIFALALTTLFFAPSVASAQEKAKGGSPDFGGITKVSREVEAVGSTQELAVLAALQSAVAQVNGARIASQLQSARAGFDVSVNGKSAGSVRSEAFVQRVVAASQGAVTGFEVLSQEEIDKVDEQVMARVQSSDRGDSVNGGKSSIDLRYQKMRSYWKVRVRVDVAQYRAPDEQGRPKIVVALPKTSAGSYVVGDSQVNANELARTVRGRLSNILTQTKRFIVLDREFGGEMQAEIDRINSGQVRVQDSARLGQQLATDLILIPIIERFEYVRSVRQLRMSDRQLVSYAGGGRITLRLLNASTGEIVMSESFEHKLAPADPSTLPRVIDGKSMASEMMDVLSGQIGSAVVTEIFPISVISLDGDQVVLSQGGEALQVGQRWQAIYLGDELKDPQTGRSLGRSESPVGTVRINRVSTQTSYGKLEEGAASLNGKPFRPGVIQLRKKLAVANHSGKSVATTQDTASQTSPSRKAVGPQSDSDASPTKSSPGNNDDNKW